MPFADPTPTFQDLVVKAVHNGNEAIKTVARGAAEMAEPFRMVLSPPMASELLPTIPELVTTWFGVAERVLAEERDLAIDLAELAQSILVTPDGRAKKLATSSSSSSPSKTPVAA